MVTDRIKPLQIQGRVAAPRRRCPTTGAASGIVTGDSANELLPLALDNNVHISEYKVATCDIRPGPAAARPGAAGARRGVPHGARGCSRDARDARLAASLRRGRQAAHGLLHRHLGVHRLQGVRGGVQGVEPDPDVDPGVHRQLLRQHGRPRRRHLAPRRVHRAARAGGRPGRRVVGRGRRSAGRRSTAACRPIRRATASAG